MDRGSASITARLSSLLRCRATGTRRPDLNSTSVSVPCRCSTTTSQVHTCAAHGGADSGSLLRRSYGATEALTPVTRGLSK